jgi:hypothetical protein
VTMKPLPFIAGFLLTVYSGTVFAAPSIGPTWEVFAVGGASIVVAGFWLWVGSVSRKQADTEKMVVELQKALLSSYHPKNEVGEMMREVRDALKDLRTEFRDNQREWKETFSKFESLYGR